VSGTAQREGAVDDWDAHWGAFGSASERNPAQAYRRRLVLRLVEREGAPRRLLDIGSGQGDMLLAARQRWPEAELAGLEVSERAVVEARAKVPDAAFEVRNLLEVAEPPSEFTGWAGHAVCSEVLEHVDDPLRMLMNARAYMASGCRLVVTVPGGRMSAFDRHIGHRRHYTPKTLADLLRSAELDVVETSGAGFPFFNVYRALVIARGEKLVDDAVGGRAGTPGLPARAAMTAFRPLFRLNLNRSPWGTQIVALARQPQRV
jgi:SAM-dependent methyltransferase